MSSDDASASSPSAATRSRAPGAGSGGWIDVLRAGLCVAGAGLVWVALSARMTAGATRSRASELAPLVAVLVVSAIVAAWLAFPERPKGVSGGLLRVAAVAPVGLLMAFGAAVGFANALQPDKSLRRAIACAAVGVAIAAVGAFPRRPPGGARTGVFADLIIGGAPIVLPAIAGAAYVEAWRGWAVPALRAAIHADGLRFLFGLATLVAAGVGVWIARDRAGRRWAVVVAPALALLGTLHWVRHELAAENARAIAGVGYAAIERSRSAAVERVVTGASGGALAAALLLAVGALALGVRASRGAPPVSGKRREIAVFAALATTIGVYALLLLVRVGGLSTDDRLVTFVAAVPAAVAAVGVWLAAADADDPDAAADGLAAAGCALGALAIAGFARALVAERPDGSLTGWPDIGPILGDVHKGTLLATAAHAAPVLVLTLVALPARRLRPAFARASVALAAVVILAGLAPSLVRAEVSAAAAEIHAPWLRRLTPGLALPELRSSGSECDVVPDDVVFVGSDRVARDGHDLGAAGDLDSEAGCAALVGAIDRSRAGRTDALRIGADAKVPWGRLECVARAIAARTGGAPACRFDWIASHEGGGAPACVPVSLSGPTCPESVRASKQAARAWPRLLVLTARGRLEGAVDADAVDSKPFPELHFPEEFPRERWGPTAVAAAPDVQARDVLSLIARTNALAPRSNGGVPVVVAEIGARNEGTEKGAVELRVRTRVAPAAPILEALRAQLGACHAPPSAPRSGALFALVAEGGKLARVFVGEGSHGDPDATRCMRDVLATAAWPAGPEQLVAFRYDLTLAATP